MISAFSTSPLSGQRIWPGPSTCSYINPKTGTCANSLKTMYGLNASENIVENAYGQWNGYTHGIERRAIDSLDGRAR